MSLASRAAALDWHHSIDLGGGVVTQGRLDLRPAAARVPLPASLRGMRCLDVGTRDGFWAFEMERRGAADVVGIDVEGGEAFGLAREALGSRAVRRDLSVYDLDPAAVGRFDVVLVGSLLSHLRDPVLALQRVAAVCAGEVVIAGVVELGATLRWPRTPVARLEGLGRPSWWLPNRAALLRMVTAAGMEIGEATRPYFVALGDGQEPSSRGAWAHALRAPQGREDLVARLWGVPHVAVRARPAGAGR